ncbi:MAG: ChbG/HpnK family deacetylase [Candidatus Omnitrophota bacterium]|nr:ChbG/HpnK family deacetylase [Candidatus Omnitrophota bacterium]
MSCTLIVNADDCNQTDGVTRGILEGVDRGIVSSTTFLVNFPVRAENIRKLKKYKGLGIGLHLNITRGTPVSKPAGVRSLLDGTGHFKRIYADKARRVPTAAHVHKEYCSQVRSFQKIFGRLPTHLDTHHQVHDHPFFFEALRGVAAHFKLPVRRSRLLLQPFFAGRLSQSGVRYPDYLFGYLLPSGHWRLSSLEGLLENLPEGISEIMCHPGRSDAGLRAISSFTVGRERELAAFVHPRILRIVKTRQIRLSHYGLCYN